MLPLIAKFIIGLIISLTNFLIVKKLTKNTDKMSLYMVLIILIITLPTIILYETKYTALISLISYILSIILYKRYFKINLITSIILCSFAVLLISLSDLIFSSINLLLFSYNEVRNIWYISVVNNVLVSILSISIAKREIVSNKIIYLCKKIDTKTGYKIAVFAIISILIIAKIAIL